MCPDDDDSDTNSDNDEKIDDEDIETRLNEITCEVFDLDSREFKFEFVDNETGNRLEIDFGKWKKF